MARKKPLPPRRKRMKRAARLNSARHWLSTYKGRRVVSAYARWFGVDLACALTELRMLGAPLEPAYVAQIETTIRERNRKASEDRADDRIRAGDAIPEGFGTEWDDDFAVVAGFTEGGAPFGIRWDEIDDADQPLVESDDPHIPF